MCFSYATVCTWLLAYFNDYNPFALYEASHYFEEIWSWCVMVSLLRAEFGYETHGFAFYVISRLGKVSPLIGVVILSLW